MLTLRMAQWPDGTGIEQVASSWQIAKDAQFEEIMDESLEDETYIGIWYSNVVVPIDGEYFGRSKRHFDDGSETTWMGPVRLFPAEAGDGIDLKPEVVIERPVARLDRDEILNPELDSFTLKSGSFRCDNDGHHATNWVLRDGAGRAVYVKMYDTENKTALSVLKEDVHLENINTLMLEVNHVTTNSFESNFSKHKIKLFDCDFEMVSNTKSISPIMDHEFTFKILTEDYPLEKYVLRNDEDVVMLEGLLTDETTIVIPREMLDANSTYYMDIYQIGKDEDIRTIVLYTSDIIGTYRTDPNYKYEGVYVDSGMTLDNVVQCATEQFLDNGIPISVGSDGIIKLYNFNRRLNTITISDLPQEYLEKATDKDALNAKMVDTERILLDRRTGTDDCPEFSVFDYGEQLLLTSLERENESRSTGLNNNLAINLSSRECFYFAKDGDDLKFYKMDVDTLEREELPLRPDLLDEKANLAYIGNGKLVSFNSSEENHVYTYDISDKIWHAVTLVPDPFDELTLTTFMRKDGKIACFNTGNDTNDVLLFDPTDNTMSVEENDLASTVDLDTTIRLRNGQFLRMESGIEDAKIYIYK